jgi:hypothetical protein
MNRRELLAGMAALGLAGTAVPALADGGARAFRILRGGSDIGRHVLTARQVPEGVEIAIDIDIRVAILGITAYRYELTNREVWSGGRIVSVRTEVNDDGEKAFARIARAGEGLEIDGSSYSGPAPADAVTTSYYTRAFIQRRPWVSTQSGKPLEVAIDSSGGATPRYAVRGDLETNLIYDAAGEWIGCEFDASGEPGVYELTDASGGIAALWAAS